MKPRIILGTPKVPLSESDRSGPTLLPLDSILSQYLMVKKTGRPRRPVVVGLVFSGMRLDLCVVGVSPRAKLPDHLDRVLPILWKSRSAHVMTPSFQDLESTANPGRFNCQARILQAQPS